MFEFFQFQLNCFFEYVAELVYSRMCDGVLAFVTLQSVCFVLHVFILFLHVLLIRRLLFLLCCLHLASASSSRVDFHSKEDDGTLSSVVYAYIDPPLPIRFPPRQSTGRVGFYPTFSVGYTFYPHFIAVWSNFYSTF